MKNWATCTPYIFLLLRRYLYFLRQSDRRKRVECWREEKLRKSQVESSTRSAPIYSRPWLVKTLPAVSNSACLLSPLLLLLLRRRTFSIFLCIACGKLFHLRFTLLLLTVIYRDLKTYDTRCIVKFPPNPFSSFLCSMGTAFTLTAASTCGKLQ